MPRLSPAAKAARRLGIGSSDVATILGISPYKDATPFGLWLEKTGQLDEVDELETPEQTLGHEFESTLVRLAVAELVKEGILGAGRLEIPDLPLRLGTVVDGVIALASLDGIYHVGDAAYVLEAKHVGVGMHDGWVDDDDGIPQHVRVQTQWQLLVSGAVAAFVSAVVMGRWRIYRVNPDRDFWPLMLEAAASFWQRVRTGHAPDLDGSARALAYLERKYPAPPESVIAEMPDDVDALVEQHIAAQATIKDLEDQRTVVGQKIRDAIGAAGVDEFIGDERKATWKANKSGKRVLLTKRVRGA